MKAVRILFLVLLAASAAAQTEPWLEVSSEVIDFGYVPQNSMVLAELIIKSNFDDTLKIDRIETFYDGIVITPQKAVLLPGDTLRLKYKLFTSRFIGKKMWGTRIYSNENIGLRKITVMAHVFGRDPNFRTVTTEPYIINASQFGDKGPDEFEYKIINLTDEFIPLRLLYADTTFFDLQFPVYIEPDSEAEGKIVLNDLGKKSDFEETITFEFINDKSEAYNFSIPIRRKIFKP